MTTPTAREAAIAHVTLWADTATTPALTAGEVGGIVDGCALADADGLAPSDTDWVPTYWLPRAVQRALELRASRAATWTDVTTDGTSVSASQAAAALRGEAVRWGRRCGGSV